MIKYLMGGIAAGAMVTTALAAPFEIRTAEVMTHPARGDMQVVDGAKAHLAATESGITFNYFARELTPGNVYTAWFVVINDPTACSESPCTSQDVLERYDQVAANVAHADGTVADEQGIGSFFAHFAPGPVPGGWYDAELNDPFSAEVHLLLMDHGPVSEGQRDDMLTTLRGGCSDESVPDAFPDVARADGTAGPNTCQLYQAAIIPPE